MDGVNKVILIGNVGKNPESRGFDSGSTVVSFSLAVGETFKDKSGEKKEATEWFTCVTWNDKLGAMITKYVTKGMKIFIEGKFKTRTYEDKDGNKRYLTEVIINEIKFLGSKQENNSEDIFPERQNAPTPDRAIPDLGSNEPLSGGDDLPF